MFGKNRNKHSSAGDGYGDVFIISPDHHVYFGAITPSASALPDGFLDWHNAASEVTNRYLNGEVSRTAALVRLAELKFTDVAGTEWALGVTSHRWFSRKPGQTWQQGAFPSVPTMQSPPVWRAEQVDVMTETVVPPPVLGQNPPDWATVGVDNDDLMGMFTDDAVEAAPAPREGSTDAMVDTTVSLVENFANTPSWGVPDPVPPVVDDSTRTAQWGDHTVVPPTADNFPPVPSWSASNPDSPPVDDAGTSTDGEFQTPAPPAVDDSSSPPSWDGPEPQDPAAGSTFAFTPDEGMAHTDLPEQPWVSELKNLGWDDFDSPTDGFPTAFFDGDMPPNSEQEGSDE